MAREHGGYLCGNGEQAAMEEQQNQMSEPGQWNKTSHRDVVKTGKAHFFHLGFLCFGAGRSSTCAASQTAPDQPYRNVCVVCVITDKCCVSGPEAEGLPRAEPSLF